MEPPASVPDNPPKEKAEKSYLATAADYIPSWGGSRSATPKPATAATVPGESSGLKNQHGGDHQTQHWHGLSRKRYPADCPPLNARWFYAVDVSWAGTIVGQLLIVVTTVSETKAKADQECERRWKASSAAEEVHRFYTPRFERY